MHVEVQLIVAIPDIDGHPQERNVQLAFEELRFFTSSLKILGAYRAHPFRRTLKS